MTAMDHSRSPSETRTMLRAIMCLKHGKVLCISLSNRAIYTMERYEVELRTSTQVCARFLDLFQCATSTSTESLRSVRSQNRSLIFLKVCFERYLQNCARKWRTDQRTAGACVTQKSTKASEVSGTWFT